MSWVKLDDDFPGNRKIRKLPDAAFRLHVEALCWCAKNLTDGKIGPDEVGDVSSLTSARAGRLAAVLVDHGVWEARPGGEWEIHDYLEFNPSRADVMAEREKAARRQKAWRERQRGDGPTDPPGVGPEQISAENEQDLPQILSKNEQDSERFEPVRTIFDRKKPQVVPDVDHADDVDRNAVTNGHPPPPPLPQELKEPPPPTPSAGDQEGGGGGEDLDVSGVLGAVASAWGGSAKALERQRRAVAAALTRGWRPDALARHLAERPPPVILSAGDLVGHRLRRLPESPEHCGRRCCVPPPARLTAVPGPWDRPALRLRPPGECEHGAPTGDGCALCRRGIPAERDVS